MIRWTERADAYRMSVTRFEDGLAYALMGLGLVLLALATASCSIGWFVAPLLLLRALVLFLHRFWIEVPLRGGPARWQGPGMAAPSEPVEVRRFDVEGVEPNAVTPYTRFVLVAVLQDGRVLRPWKGLSSGDPRLVDRVARQLNEVLDVSPEEERLYAAPAVIERWYSWKWSFACSPLVIALILLVLAALLLPALSVAR